MSERYEYIGRINGVQTCRLIPTRKETDFDTTEAYKTYLDELPLVNVDASLQIIDIIGGVLTVGVDCDIETDITGTQRVLIQNASNKEIFIKTLHWIEELLNNDKKVTACTCEEYQKQRAICPVCDKEEYDKLRDFDDEASQTSKFFQNELGQKSCPSVQVGHDVRDNVRDAVQEEYVMDLSRFAVENKYKSKMLGSETAVWMVDIKGLMDHIRENYILTPKK